MEGGEDRTHSAVIGAKRAPFRPYMAECCSQNELEKESAKQHPAMAQERARITRSDLVGGLVQPTSAGEDTNNGQGAEQGRTPYDRYGFNHHSHQHTTPQP